MPKVGHFDKTSPIMPENTRFSGTSSRRAFSVCYMNGNTKASHGEQFSMVFGEGALQAA